MYGIKSDLFLSILRHILTILGAIVVTKGWITSDESGQVAGALVTIISIAFAAFFHSTSNGTIETVSTTSNATAGVERKTTTTVTGVTPEIASAVTKEAAKDGVVTVTPVIPPIK